MNLLKKILCFLFCLVFIAIHAQPINFRFSNYTPIQGLSNGGTRCILKDTWGFIWIGTADGLNQFDGHNFKIFRHNRYDSLSLPGNFINSIAEDSSGWLWIGTNDGIAHMNPWDGHCEIFHHHNGDTSSLNSDYDNRVFIDRGNKVWIGNGDGVSEFIPKSKTFQVLFGNKGAAGGFGSFCEENSDSYWFGSYDGLVHFTPSENSWDVYKLSLSSKGVTTVNCVFIDHRGTLWCGTWGNGLCRFDRETKTLTSFRWDLSPENPSIVNIVSSILETEDAQHQHRLMVGTGQGLLVLNNDSFPSSLENIPFVIHDLTNPESIPGDFIVQIIEDKQHIIWLCENGGLSCIIPLHQVFRRLDNGIKGQVTKILPADSSYYITSWYANGVTVCDKNWKVSRELLRLPPSSPFLDNGQVSDVIRDVRGQLWFATFRGLVRSNAALTEFEVFNHDANDSGSISESRITCVIEDDHHRIWAGTYRGGLNMYDPETHHFTQFHHDEKNKNSLTDDLIWLLRKDHSGTLWIGTNNGLCSFDENQQGKNNFVNYFSQIEGGSIHDIYEDDSGILWISTNKGLNKLNPASGKAAFYSTEDGLANYNVQGITGDDEGNLWIGTDAGISRFNPRKIFFTNYSVKNGLPDLRVISVFYKNVSGTIYGGGTGNLLVFNPHELNQPLEAPPVYITEIKIGNVPLGMHSLTTNPQLQLLYDQNVITFSYTAPEFIDPEDVHYFIKLGGADRDWLDAGNRSSATYASLNPGSYTFHVKAKNADGMMSEREALIHFIIAPPFWKTWWFITLLVLAIAFIFFFAVRYISTRKLREQVLILEKEKAVEHERARISRDMHDDLGSGLTKIAILSEVTRRQLNEKEKAEHQLHTISDSARTLVDNLNEIIWTLNPQHDNLDSMMAYIRDYTTRYFDALEIDAHFDYPASIPRVHLSDQQRRNIFLVVKETLNNISKHAHATTVTISLNAEKNFFQIRISDNGQGFSVSKARAGGNGLKNMRQRMNEMGGEFEISSETGNGTITILSQKI